MALILLFTLRVAAIRNTACSLKTHDERDRLSETENNFVQ